MGSMLCIRDLENKKEMPLAANTAASNSFAFDVLMILFQNRTVLLTAEKLITEGQNTQAIAWPEKKKTKNS